MAEVQISTNSGSTATIESGAVEALATGLRGPLLRAGDAGYDDARLLWNGMMDKHPALIARCTGMGDVISAVNFAREHNIVLAIRGGGHNVAGNACCEGGFMIDMALMNGVRVDPQARTVRVQGGATLAQMDRETQVFGLAVPAGVVSTTGVAGLTLGGGTGWQTRKRGLTIDNLLSVDIVTTDGQPRVANEKENADLFWAVRGGGGNFGVVTSFEFRAFPLGPNVLLFAPFYSADLARPAIRAFRDFVREAPEEFGAAFLFWFVPANPFFPAEHHGKPIVIPLLVYSGDVEKGQQLVEPLRKIGSPLVDLSGPIPWTALQGMFDPFVPKKDLQYYWKNLYLDRIDDEVLDYLVEVGSTIPSKNTYLVFQAFGGAMSKVGAADTAFGRRDMPYMFEFDSMWSDPNEAEKNIAWTRKMWAEMQKYSNGGLYLNFPGFGEEGEKLVRSALGNANYDRLAKIKAKYDPTNLFRLNQNIKPAA